MLIEYLELRSSWRGPKARALLHRPELTQIEGLAGLDREGDREVLLGAVGLLDQPVAVVELEIVEFIIARREFPNRNVTRLYIVGIITARRVQKRDVRGVFDFRHFGFVAGAEIEAIHLVAGPLVCPQGDDEPSRVRSLVALQPLPIVARKPAGLRAGPRRQEEHRSEEHTSELQSRFGISHAVFCLKKTTHHSHLELCACAVDDIAKHQTLLTC